MRSSSTFFFVFKYYCLYQKPSFIIYENVTVMALNLHHMYLTPPISSAIAKVQLFVYHFSQLVQTEKAYTWKVNTSAIHQAYY